MKILLVEPSYYTKYPPLALMKLASYHRSRGSEVYLVRGTVSEPSLDPDRIEITSLFTYAWQPVHEAIEFYHALYPEAKIRVGGIYASLMPERIASSYCFVDIHIGLYPDADRYVPAYDILAYVEKWRGWNSSILFTSRGCLRSCPFCMVPRLEGKIKSIIHDVQEHVYPGHKRVILWDNNFLASPDWKRVIRGLREIDLPVDFNQGIDARLLDEEKARMLAELRMPLVRLAFDDTSQKDAITNAIELLANHGIRRRDIFVYTLYNFHDDNHHMGDSPSTFFERVKLVLELGCVAYPMRFEPLTSLKKNQYVSPLWTPRELEMLADARRVIGFGGSFPPYAGLVKKFQGARSFDEAFSLRSESGKASRKSATMTGAGRTDDYPAKLVAPEL